MRRSLVICLIAGMATLLEPSTASAEESPQALIAAGQYDEARALLISQGVSGLERAYFDGIILHHQERYTEAVAHFRRILESRPEQILVRQALVKSLLVLDDYEAAEYHLEQLIEIDNNERSIAQYRRAQQSILVEKPYGITGSFSIVPSTNINRGTGNDVFSTDIGDFRILDEGQETAGTSIKTSLSAFRRFELESGDRVVLNGSVSASQNLADNDLSYSLSVGTSYRRPKPTGFWELSPNASLNFISGERSYRTLGLDYKLRRRTSRKNIWTYELGGYHGHFYEDEFRNGLYLDSAISLRRLVSPTLSVTSALGYDVGLPERDDIQYRDYSASVDVAKSWSNGWRTSVGVEFNYRGYAENFTAVDFRREDRGRSLRASVANSRISFRGLSPDLGCSLKTVESNVAFYDYSVTECGIGLTRRF